MNIKNKLTLLNLSIILYILSLCFPALGCNYFGADTGRYTVEYGYTVLLTGWLGFLVLNFAWLANSLYIITLFLAYKKSSKTLFLAIICLLLGLNTFSLYSDTTQHVGLYPGFYLWLASFIVLIILGIVNLSVKRSS